MCLSWISVWRVSSLVGASKSEGDGQSEGESEVESGDSSDSSGRGSNFSDGSQMSDDDDEEYPEDDPVREAEAMEAYRNELRQSSSQRAKEVADGIRADVRAGDTPIILAYPQDAEPDGEDVRLRPYVGVRVQIIRVPQDEPWNVVIVAPLQRKPGERTMRWWISKSRVKRVVGIRGTPLRATGRVPLPGEQDQLWRAQPTDGSAPPPPRPHRAMDQVVGSMVQQPARLPCELHAELRTPGQRVYLVAVTTFPEVNGSFGQLADPVASNDEFSVVDSEGHFVDATGTRRNGLIRVRWNSLIPVDAQGRIVQNGPEDRSQLRKAQWPRKPRAIREAGHTCSLPVPQVETALATALMSVVPSELRTTLDDADRSMRLCQIDRHDLLRVFHQDGSYTYVWQEDGTDHGWVPISTST